MQTFEYAFLPGKPVDWECPSQALTFAVRQLEKRIEVLALVARHDHLGGGPCQSQKNG